MKTVKATSCWMPTQDVRVEKRSQLSQSQAVHLGSQGEVRGGNVRPRSGGGCRPEEGKGDGRGVWSVGKGKIKPSREPPSGAEDFISPEQRSTFSELLQRVFNCVCVCVVSCCPVVVLFDVVLLRGTRAWTRQLLPLRSAPLPPGCWPRLPAVENVSQLMTFICVSP